MKDIPPFVHFLIPELAAFRCFFWAKSILQDDRLRGVKFSVKDSRYDGYLAYSKRIIELYNRIPVTGIWNVETMNSTLNQIEFYVEAGAFSGRDDVMVLFDKLRTLIGHIEKQAESGVKFKNGETPGPNAPQYRMFVNELILGNNTLLAEIGDAKVTYLNHSVLYFIATIDNRFNTAMFSNLENLMKKSTLISTVGEKDRAGFFNRLRSKIHDRRVQLT